MIRTCNGTDPNLLGDSATGDPCTCGLTFNDVLRSVVHPHVFLPTAADRARWAAWLETVSVEDIVSRSL